MSEQRALDPKKNEEHAAQEVVIELIRSGAITPSTNIGSGDKRGELLAESVIAAHKKLTEYYKGL